MPGCRVWRLSVFPRGLRKRRRDACLLPLSQRQRCFLLFNTLFSFWALFRTSNGTFLCSSSKTLLTCLIERSQVSRRLVCVFDRFQQTSWMSTAPSGCDTRHRAWNLYHGQVRLLSKLIRSGDDTRCSQRRRRSTF